MAIAQVPYFTSESTCRLDDLLYLVCEELQISRSRYQQAEQRYKAVTNYLEATDSPFVSYRPNIYPQGSMALNTTVRPLEGPHDLDFVLELSVSHELVDPMKLILRLYGYFRDSGIYRPMTSLLKRCIRIKYENEFYLDILPACKNLSVPGTCIKVPDRELVGWCDSNPLGYVDLFQKRCVINPKMKLVIDSAEPIPDQQRVKDKSPLQLCVQLLKRDRDLRYSDQELAPISIVLTTLAAKHYSGESSVSEAFSAILIGIVNEVATADARADRIRVHNPSNLAEDLSERWDKQLEAYLAFKKGIRQLHRQWFDLLSKNGNVSAELEALFGEPVKIAFTKQAQRLQEDRLRNKLGVTPTGMISVVSPSASPIPNNIFYGEE